MTSGFPPSFTKYPLQPTLYGTNSGNTTIVCRPEAAPAATITWLLNGSPLNPGEDEDSRIRLLPNGNLFFSPVLTSDAGNYTCVAENPLGTASNSGNLLVLGNGHSFFGTVLLSVAEGSVMPLAWP